MAASRRRTQAVLVALVLAVTAGCASGGASPGDHPTGSAAGPLTPFFRPPDTLPDPADPSAATGGASTAGMTAGQAAGLPSGGSAVIAQAAVPKVALYDDPGSAAPATTMRNPTSLAVPLVFLVREDRGDWLRVQVPARPNERTAWVHRSDVTLTGTPFRVRVELAAHRLTAFDGDVQVLEARVAIGTPETPTPTGNFYIDGAFKLANPNGPYGAYALSVAAFSNVLTRFSGGPGQIALHGTNRPALLGTPASHGCVRMTNDDITRLVKLVPVGTPVEIVA